MSHDSINHVTWHNRVPPQHESTSQWVTREWVLSHTHTWIHTTRVNESRLTRHVPWVMSHVADVLPHESRLMSESCPMSHVSWVTSHESRDSFLYETWLFHIWDKTHVPWVTSHQSRLMSHVSYLKESCLVYEWVTSHIWGSHESRAHTHTHSLTLTHAHNCLKIISYTLLQSTAKI